MKPQLHVSMMSNLSQKIRDIRSRLDFAVLQVEPDDDVEELKEKLGVLLEFREETL